MIRVDVALAFLVTVVVVLHLLAWGTRAVLTEADCLEVGYPTAHVTWNFKSYCTREENEYEVTVSLEAARGRQN